MMTMFTRTVFLSVLLFAAHAKKSSPSNSTSNEDEEKANVDNHHFHWYDKLWLYPTIMIMDSMTDPDGHDVEQVPYKTIKKFDVSWDDPGLGLYYAKYPYFEGLWGKTLPQR